MYPSYLALKEVDDCISTGKVLVAVAVFVVLPVSFTVLIYGVVSYSVFAGTKYYVSVKVFNHYHLHGFIPLAWQSHPYQALLTN